MKPVQSTSFRSSGIVALTAVASLVASLAACGGGNKTTTGVVTPPDTVGANQYRNAVLSVDFPDPGIVRAADGAWYAYATQTTGRKIQVSHSSNLKSWSTPTEALPAGAPWVAANYFAPDVHFIGGQYVMYFASEVDAAHRPSANDDFCIGTATASAPGGPFTATSAPLVCGPSFTTIDPMAFHDPVSGKLYLYWGSAGIPIQVRELDASGLSFAAGSTVSSLTAPRPGNGGYDTGLIEGPWVQYHDPYYYLYFSGNGCCGAGAHYAVMVARSSSPTGPFTTLTVGGGAEALPILRGGTKWQNPGHNATFTDDAGTDWIIYHAIDSANPYLIPGNTSISRRPLLIDKITYVDGWPTIAGSVPSSTAQTKPVITP